MKHFLIIVLLTAFTNIAFASDTGETATECPMMREETERTNPKANLGDSKPKSKRTKQASAQ